VIDLDAALGQQLLDVAVRQAVTQMYRRTATSITSRGKRYPGRNDSSVPS
jgi:hypothetical protein